MTLKISDKLLKPISEVNYLRADNVDRYRVMIRYFYEEYEKIHYWLYKEDVYAMMVETGLFPDYTIDLCQSDLTSLTNWGNLTAMQDTTKVLTLEEFTNRKYRYQLSEYTIEIERMTMKLETLEIEGASLEPTLLERIHNRILELPQMVDKDDQEVSSWWNDLNSDFIRLNRNYQDYIRTLNSAKAEEMMKTQQFLIFKEKIIQYLRTFVKGLQEQALVLEEYIKEIDFEVIEILIQKIIAYELTIPRIDRVLNQEDLYENCMGRWHSLYSWFVGDDGESEVNRMSDITLEIIRKITRYAQQIGELHNQGANRKEEYRHLANIFGKCTSLQEAHKMSAMVFGVDTCLHFKNLNDRDTDSIDSGVFEEAPTFRDLEPRTRIAQAKSKRKPATDYQLEKTMQKQAILREQEKEQKLLQAYIKDNVLDFKAITHLDAYSRKIFLNWLSRGLASTQHRARTQWGSYYIIDDRDAETMCKITCEDGDFYMPAFRICFEEEIIA